MNKLYLYHRPTQHVMCVGIRGSFGWQLLESPVEFCRSLGNMYQRAANDLYAAPAGHQDDFILVMDDAAGAPYATDKLYWDANMQMRLEPAYAFAAAIAVEPAGAGLQRLLELVTGRAPVEDKAQRRELRAIDVLRKENEELRAGIAHLIELMELRRLGEEIYLQEVGDKGPHPERREWLKRTAIIWTKARGWAEGLEKRLGNWKKEQGAA